MAKRTKRRSVRSQRNNAGCMWGLISLFDFRRGLPSHRLLSNEKYGSTTKTGTEYSTAILDSLRSFPNKHEDGTLGDEIREDQANLGMTSVKSLMEEEMSKHFEQEIPCKKADPKLQHEVYSQRIYKQGSNKSKCFFNNQENNLDDSTSLDGLYSDITKPNEVSTLSFYLAAFLMEFYSSTSQQMHADGNNKFDLLPALQRIGSRSHKHLNDFDGHFDQKISFFRQTLADVTQAMVEKPVDTRWFFESEEFIEVLEILNSDQELFPNLLQDPDSLLKCIQHFQSAQVSNIFNQGADRSFENAQLIGEESNNSGKCMESDSNQLVQNQNRYNFFWRKCKSKGTKPSKEDASSKSLNRIVVLKPSSVRTPNTSVIVTPNSSPLSRHVLGHKQKGERIVSHFSLREITRRLGHLVSERRKTQHAISMDNLHRISDSSGEADDPSKLFKSERAVPGLANSSLDDKKLSESLSFASRKIEKNDSEECEVNINGRISASTSRSPSSIYEEAKKHIAEMLDDRDDDWANYPAPEPLERVLSLPRYNELSPVSTTQRDMEQITSAEEGGDPSFQQLNQEELVDTNMLELSLIRQDLNGEGSSEIIKFEAVDDQSIMGSNQFTILSELSTDGLIVADEICEEESSTLRALGSCEEESSMAIQSKLLPSMASESTIEKPEQPSPVSVLETFLSEDIASPESPTENYDIQSQRQLANYEVCNNSLQDAASPYLNESSVDCLLDKQARFDYVEAVLEASGLTNEFSERWNLEDQLLEPSLFDAIGIFFCFLQDDPKLLFDCINEVLVEIHERFLKCTPWMSFIKQNILSVPRSESLIQEVSKGLESHLQILVPNTLDQLVRKDLEGRSWMDLRFEAEKITSEICDIILNDLVKESVRASCFWSLNSQYIRILI